MGKDRTAFKYTGQDGAHFIGIPARNLTDEEFAALEPAQQEAVKSGNLYEEVAALAEDALAEAPADGEGEAAAESPKRGKK